MGDSLGLIGKRLLLLLSDGASSAASDVDQAAWLRGTVRAVSVSGLASPGVEVFLEFEDSPWRQRSWVQLYGDEVRAAMMESTIVWAPQHESTISASGGTSTSLWPALVFQPLVDRVGLGSVVPVEFFGTRKLEFLPTGNSLQRFEAEKDVRHSLLQEHPALHAAISNWHRDSELQEILRKGPYTIQGRRVQVYQPEYEEPWALGLVSQHNPASHIMEITMDQGEETQVVDPRVIHVMLAMDNADESHDRRRKELDGGKGEGGRRRRTASEDDEDMNLKRFKGAGEGQADDQNGTGSGKDCEPMVTRGGEAPPMGVVEGKDGVGGISGRGSSNASPEVITLASQSLANSNSSQQDHSSGRSVGFIKENGNSSQSQDKMGPVASTVLSTSTPTPPPLKPAPSAFSNAFPSLGQMPNLVPGTPAPKCSPTAPAAERDDGVLAGYPKTAALVSPGPVTISSPSQDNAPSVVLSAPPDPSQKAPVWGSPPDASQTPKTTTLAAGFSPSQPKQTSGAVFGDVPAQTNGSSQENKPFGFYFANPKEPQQQASDPSQNLFFQCMSQTQAQSPSIAQGQAKDNNYFTALSECLSKESPSLFKPAAPSEGLKKAVVASASAGLFGSAPAGSLVSLKEQPKVPDAKPTGNGILMGKSFAAGGDTLGKLPAGFPTTIGSSPVVGLGDVSKPATGLATSLGPGSAGLSGAGGGMRNPTGASSGFGMLSGSKVSETHENLFLQASKESNPFLAYGGAGSHGPFSALSTSKLPSSVSSPLDTGGSGILNQDPPASDSQPNLFTMVEPPKGMLSSQFTGSSSSSSSAPFMSAAQDRQQVLKPDKEDTMGGAEPCVDSEGGLAESPATPTTFDQTSQNFSLDERGQMSKRDSDSSSNSDLSDLSEAEETSEQSQKPGGQLNAADGAEAQKLNTLAAAKSRPRSKPFKVCQSVLKDQSKVRRLKQSGEAFLQDGSCISVAPHLHKCRECRLERYRKSREQDLDDDDPNVACRFFHFRRLAFTKKGVLRVEGFLSPQQSDNMAMGLWLPSPNAQGGLDLDTSKYILANVGDQFCQLVMSEKEAMMMVEPHQKVAWKRAVRGVREMCDVCETTLFNIHWVCRKCGFGVCLDCYRLRRSRPHDVDDDNPDDEVFSWLKCAKGQPHEPQNLMPTQIIPGTALYNIGDMVHAARGKWGIKANCPCTSRHSKPLVRPTAPNGLSQSGATSSTGNGASTSSTPRPDGDPTTALIVKVEPGTEASSAETSSATSSTSSNATSPGAVQAAGSKDGKSNPSSALHWLADLATQKAKEDSKDSGSLRAMMGREPRAPFGLDAFSTISKPTSPSPKLFNSLLLGSGPVQPKTEGTSLRDLLNSGPGKLPQAPDSGVPFPSVFSSSSGSDKMKGGLPTILDHIIASVVENKIAEGRRVSGSVESREPASIPRREGVMGLSVLDPHTSHSWLCDGRLLCLQDPSNSNNWKIFRECWKQGQPVLVSGIHKKLNGSLWKPEAFSDEFGDQDVDLVNCRNCTIISDVKVREFWDGFQVISKRLQGADGQPMVLKLKDWPPGEDFRDMMPTRFDDLMDNLPLPEYTKRDGRLNLASRLPNFFVRPDLGPKMYNAYGLISTEDRKVGTTNLHLDVSDAVNVMVYVGIPEGNNNHENEVSITIEEGDVDEMTKRRVYEGKERPGALWHIYAAKDAEKIRELLRKVGEEQGQENPPDHDPIHDQSWYLDQVLRRRLYEEYGVQGWSIVQFLGDAVFIPAGAPHQVHNLYSCIKVAEDFVSPEHVKHCFRLTQEFRHLSNTHTNHEDKLQVKNIIYHAVKDAVGTLKAHESKLVRS
ncbi:lysine-specific demethylase 3B isoform X2 [Pygocentrus nattereri]|uniref:Lysine-specific demethylase n=1 Tax=Pygocentrus nattereri TaxID=42514 RepID=A0AAR2KKK0_PYGNA|nr:lysine-specific demethylase 3B isoform X2 [Pygocentrus nattereri]